MYDVIRDQKVNFGFFFPEMTLLDIPEMYQIGVKINVSLAPISKIDKNH